MLTTSSNVSTLIGRIWPVGRRFLALRWAALIVVGSALTALSAQIEVPLKPVPITMQTFAVLVVGMAYGWRLGAATLALYLAEGAIGLPVYAGFSSGPAVLFGPTGGYLFGFVLAAGIVGWLAERSWDRNVWTTAIAMLIGNFVLYVPGLIVLAQFVGWDQTVPLGLTPFLVGDAVKLALAACLMPVAWRLIGRPQA